jgi:hypothetical protein
MKKPLGFALLLPVLAAACADPDRVLFVTSSQLGITVDGATQQGNVSLSRFEGVIAPVYDGGAVPPVYARLGTDGGFFTPKVSQLYTTGDAALIASGRTPGRTCTRTQPGGGQPPKQTDSGTTGQPLAAAVPPVERIEVPILFGTGALMLTTSLPAPGGDRTIETASAVQPAPQGSAGSADFAKDNFKCPDNPPPLLSKEPDKRKRMFFGTGTTLGLGLKGTADAPAAIDLGYRRRELSLIPLTKVYGRDSNPTGEEKYASVLAAIDMRIRAKCDSAELAKGDGNCISQFFATGEAATGLASQPTIQDFFGADADKAFRKK